MKTPTNKCNDIENSDVDFQLYLNMIKNDTITWEVFFQIMKDMISFLDLTKSKKLIFYLIEELKGFKCRDKLQLNKVSELEKSIEILRNENESLKNECDELKGKNGNKEVWESKKEKKSFLGVVVGFKVSSFPPPPPFSSKFPSPYAHHHHARARHITKRLHSI